MTQAHTQTPAPKHAHSLADMLKHADAAANPGMRAMRLTQAAQAQARALGLAERPAPAKPATPRVSARKPKPAPAQAPGADDAPEQQREWRVGVLVEAGESAQTCIWVSVQAGGMRRAARQARADAFRLGHKPVGVCAVLTLDAPEAVLKATLA